MAHQTGFRVTRAATRAGMLSGAIEMDDYGSALAGWCSTPSPPGRPRASRSCCCTGSRRPPPAGPGWRRRWPRPGTGCWPPISGATRRGPAGGGAGLPDVGAGRRAVHATKPPPTITIRIGPAIASPQPCLISRGLWMTLHRVATSSIRARRAGFGCRRQAMQLPVRLAGEQDTSIRGPDLAPADCEGPGSAARRPCPHHAGPTPS